MLLRDSQILALLWIAFAVHAAVAFLVYRKWLGFPLLVGVNALVGTAVVLYWMQNWYAYAFKGINWYWTDQLFPLYAICVLIVSLLFFAGRNIGNALHVTVFGFHVIALLAVALFFSFFRLDRLF
ncbi:MAG: hypothetical protein WDZ63_03775 [Burkholderiales bacterium]